MDWGRVGFDWNRARAFLVTAKEGSFSAAGRALHMAQPTVGRQVAALEEELGVVLFERVGRGLVLTEAGLELLEEVEKMGEAATRVSLRAAGRSTHLEGTVSITASELIAAHLLPPVVAALRVEHPGIEIEIVASNEARDLQRREADIAIRNFKPEHPELVATQLGARVARPYAAPAYLERLGHPCSVEALFASDPAFIAFDGTDMMLQALRGMGLPAEARHFPIVSGNHLVQWAMAKRGIAICFVMEEVGDAEPLVQRVTPDFPPLPVPMWLTAHRELRTSRRIRLVFDSIVDALRLERGPSAHM